MKKSGLTNKINTALLSLGLLTASAKEVDSGVSYGGSIAIDINRNISAGGYVASTDRTNSLYAKGGLNLVLAGRDKGKFSLRIGGGWNFRNRIAPSVELGITPKSDKPFSVGLGLGYGNFKKNEKKERNLGGDTGEEPFKCIGGTLIGESECKCPEGTAPFPSTIKNEVTCYARD